MSERRPMVLEPLRRTRVDARRFAEIVHAGQVDKAGRPYIEHVASVAKDVARCMVKFGGYDSDDPLVEEACQIAYLHDVIEDTEYDDTALFAEGFSMNVVAGVGMLTKHRDWKSYAAWIERLCATAPLPVLLVKIADVEDNSDPDRLALLPAETRARLEKKYGAALPVLKAAAERLGWKEER